MFDYDSWLSSPYDNERVISVYFNCDKCEAENEQDEVVVGSKSGWVDLDCVECGKVNSVEFGDE